MVSITLSVPENIRKQMKEFPEINWSGFVRKAIESKIERLAWKQRMLQQLESEKEYDEEALRIGDKIKEGVWKRHKEKGWGK